MKNRILRWSGIDMGPGCRVAPSFYCLDPTKLSLGRNVSIGFNVRLHTFAPMTIGDWTLIASDASAANGWHETRDLKPNAGELQVGRGVWVGMGAKLVGALTIGDYAIVGAGSVVVNDVAPGEIVAGSPARAIGQRDLADRQWNFRSWWDTATFEPLPTGGQRE